MAGRWYLRQGTNEYGPLGLAELVAYVQAGQVVASHWVRQGETNPWQPAGSTPELRLGFESASAAQRPVPAPHKSAAHLSGVLPAPLTRPAATTATAAAPRVSLRNSGTHLPPPLRAPQASAAPPVGTAASPPVPRRVAVAAPAPAFVQTDETPVAARTQRHGKNSSIGIILGLAGAGVALVIVVIVVASGAFVADDVAKVDQPIAAAKPTGETVQETAKEVASTGGLSAAQSKALAAISKWREAGKATAVLKNIVSFQVQKAAWSDSPQSQLTVQMKVTNTSTAPLKYQSWNGAGKSGAWLVDTENALVAEVSGDATTQSIEPGKSITDTLVFATEKHDFTELRLVLPFAAVAKTGQCGYVLPASMLKGEAKVAPPQVASKPAEEAREDQPKAVEIDVPSITADEDATPGISAVKPTPTPEGDDGEPKEDIRDLIRKSKGTDKPVAIEMEKK